MTPGNAPLEQFKQEPESQNPLSFSHVMEGQKSFGFVSPRDDSAVQQLFGTVSLQDTAFASGYKKLPEDLSPPKSGDIWNRNGGQPERPIRRDDQGRVVEERFGNQTVRFSYCGNSDVIDQMIVDNLGTYKRQADGSYKLFDGNGHDVGTYENITVNRNGDVRIHVDKERHATIPDVVNNTGALLRDNNNRVEEKLFNDRGQMVRVAYEGDSNTVKNMTIDGVGTLRREQDGTYALLDKDGNEVRRYQGASVNQETGEIMIDTGHGEVPVNQLFKPDDPSYPTARDQLGRVKEQNVNGQTIRMEYEGNTGVPSKVVIDGVGTLELDPEKRIYTFKDKDGKPQAVFSRVYVDQRTGKVEIGLYEDPNVRVNATQFKSLTSLHEQLGLTWEQAFRLTAKVSENNDYQRWRGNLPPGI